ncbi:MAG: hypothetical protein KKF30_10830 [Proteobacteria bacterium]|nr:hypothetical protein [Pseudomonadota bacterium]MBU4470849.1 hypothetical protein [Pseudomonadota bacterium]MCG2753769.1 hypothetical protein [Desulfobacteraceae bacterium]
MKVRVHICFVLLMLLWASPASAERGLEVRTVDSGLIHAKPRNVATSLFTVTNKGGEPGEFMTEVILPDGWKLITNDFAFALDPNETQTRLLSFFVPQTALAGVYKFPLVVKSLKLPSVYAAISFEVNVQAVSGNSIQILNGPEFIIAGKDYSVDCVVSNQSNQAVDMKIEAESSHHFQCVMDHPDLHFEPAESKSIKIKVYSHSEFRKKEPDLLTVTARIVQSSEIQARASHKVDIIPRIHSSEDMHHRLPVKLTFSHMASYDEKWTSGLQTTVSGNGTLDEDQTKHVSFLLSTPNTSNRMDSEQYDQYRMEYSTDRCAAGAGDLLYSLTPLTEAGFLARGFEGRFNNKSFSMGAYKANSRMLDEKESQTGGFLNYQADELKNISFNYLSKTVEDENSRIWSLFSEMKSMFLTDIAMEYASSADENSSSENSRAFSADILHTNDRFLFKVKGLHAEPGFKGYYQDGTLLSTAGAFKLNDIWTISGDCVYEKQNPQLDREIGTALERHYYQTRLNHSSKTGPSFFVDLIRQDRLDAQSPGRYDFIAKSARAGTNTIFDNWHFTLMAETGKTDDKLSDNVSSFQRYTFITQYSGNTKFSGNSHITYDTSSDFEDFGKKRLTYGFNLNGKLGLRTDLKLSGRSSRQFESEYGIEHDFKLTLNHTLGIKSGVLNQSTISFGILRSGNSGSLGKEETSICTSWTIPLHVPVSHKKDFGSVKGRMYDQSSKKPIPDIVLKMEDSIAVTDKNGNFVFPGIHTGSHSLSTSSIVIQDKNMVFSNHLPGRINVSSGKKTKLDLGLVEASSFSGRIMVYDYEKPAATFDIIPASQSARADSARQSSGSNSHEEANKIVGNQGLPFALIELTQGEKTIRRLSDKKGRFSFDALVPGKYQVAIKAANIPDHHRFENDHFEMELSMGEKKEMEIKVLPVKRTMKMLPSAPLVIEEID